MSSSQLQPDEEAMLQSSSHKCLHLRLFKNGDLYFPGKLVTLNKKQSPTFESWLSELSHSMSLNSGAVWRVYTPRYGTRKVDFDDLQDGQSLVIAGQENFKKLSYDQITAPDKKKAPPFKYDADPVYHNRQYLSSGKINKIETHSVLIKVWPNGGDLRGPRRVLLSPRIRPFTLDNVLTQVNEMLKEDCLGTVEKLYMLNGIKVSDVDQIVPNGQYVACRKTERFKRAKYHDQGVKNLATSPRIERKFLAPLHTRSTNTTNQSTPEHSNESTQNSVHSYPFRQKMLASEENGFPAKPFKHTRTNEKANKNVDYDSDHGGVFKAKISNKATLDAQEVPDSRHTKTDYPIDQQKAKEVEVEKIKIKDSKKDSHQKTQGNNNNDRKSLPTYKIKKEEFDERTESATRIQAGYRSYIARQAEATKTEKNSKLNSKQYRYNDEEDKAAARIQAGFRGYTTRKKFSNIKNEEVGKKGKPDKTDKATKKQEHYADEKERAAAKIQAGFRGYQTRRKQQNQKERGEREEAALRIQSSYRSYQTRNEHDKVKPKQNTHKDNKTKQDNIIDNEPKQDKHINLEEDLWEQEEWAAIKIQTAYRGYAARKMLISTRSEENHGKSVEPSAADIGLPYKQAAGPNVNTPPTSTQLNNYDSPGKTKSHEAKNSSKEDEAAAKIQAACNTYLTRKSLINKNLHKRHTSEIDASEGHGTYRMYRSDQQDAASKIQAGYHGYRNRKFMTSFQVKITEENSAAVIQAAYRSYLFRQKNESKKNSEVENAVEKIQTGYRIHLYRQKNNFKINFKEEERNAAEKIMAGYRSYSTRQHLGDLLISEKENRAASRIQSHYRDYKTRRQLKQKITENMNNAVLKVQAGYRSYSSRITHQNYDKNRAAEKIQASFRSYHERNSIREKEEHAIKMQTAYRGHLVRQQLKRENIAAAKIQNSYRHYKARDGKKLKIIPSGKERNLPATKIQSSNRIYKSRKNLNEKQYHTSLESNEKIKQKHDAAQTIQNYYRAYRNRK